ncbi:hypothetical protein RB623_20445 [Mesorhizobium sp. LHD-90]|uniref:hypothetical protein n=1 Tax=Mesorhizobium sp. LHD-90 TaxID=3071414 RepID=UPI0027DF2C33|nr:hypothetical protein [Mesorhizobium sp. LHD-90]MDQ6436427.1 hypothetical protein [Mesorhizobium sp. LHD-90]
MSAGKPADAWLLYPDREDPQRWIVEVEKPYGDVVPLRLLPLAIDRAAGRPGRQPPLTFRWRYDREAEGSAFFILDESGRGSLQFEFLAREPIDGQRLGAAAVLMKADGAPLQTVFALSDAMDVASGAQRQRIPLIGRWADGSQEVDAIAFFSMRYYPQQELGEEEVWAAMRRAVGNFAHWRGTAQRRLP